MYEYNKTRAGLGSMVPIGTTRNIGPYNPGPKRSRPWRGMRGMGWTGGFTIPGNEQRFSVQTCSGSAASPMDSSSDLICGRSAEVDYLNRIGCVPVGFQGSHHCNTDEGNQGDLLLLPTRSARSRAGKPWSVSGKRRRSFRHVAGYRRSRSGRRGHRAVGPHEVEAGDGRSASLRLRLLGRRNVRLHG